MIKETGVEYPETHDGTTQSRGQETQNAEKYMITVELLGTESINNEVNGTFCLEE